MSNCDECFQENLFCTSQLCLQCGSLLYSSDARIAGSVGELDVFHQHLQGLTGGETNCTSCEKICCKSVDSQSVRSSPPNSQFGQWRLFSAVLQVVHGLSVDTYQNYNILSILYYLHHDKSRRKRGKWIARVTFRVWYTSDRSYRSERLGVNLSTAKKRLFLKEHN